MLKLYKDDDHVIIATTNRHQGYSHHPYDSLNMAYYVGDNNDHVLANRNLIASNIKIPLTKWVFPKISHSTNIHKVESSDLGKDAFNENDSILNVDGLYTDLPEVVLCVFHADCIPFVFYDSNKRLIGVVHAGWKGTLHKIVDAFLINWIENEKCNPHDIEVIIGPSLSKENFMVKDDVIQKVKDLAPEFTQYLEFVNDQQAYFDAVAMNLSLIQSHGILESQISVNHDCTFANSNQYFSYRRDNTTGRHITFAALK